MSVGRIAALQDYGARLTRPLPEAAPGEHFYLIDLFRGLAALAVLFWHYQHFYVLTPDGDPIWAGRDVQPLYHLFQPFYDHGRRAVQFFWLISGFVLASAYAGVEISARGFMRNRLARLYPLHILTLLVVTALQAVSIALTGQTQINAYYDPYHFVLHLFFASNWGFEQGFSFNAPIWSVSIEMAMYLMFWASLPLLFRRGALVPLAITALFAVMTQLSKQPLWTCGLFFYAGVSAYCAYRTAASVHASRAFGLTVFSGASLAIALGAPLQIPLAIAFAGLVLTLATLEASRAGAAAAKARWVGDSTYGIYLWHTPIQIIVLIAFSVGWLPREILTSPLFLAAFLALVVAVAHVSYVHFEAPMRAWLRAPRAAPKLAPAAAS